MQIRTKFLNRTVPGEIIAVELGGVFKSLVRVEAVFCKVAADWQDLHMIPGMGYSEIVAEGVVVEPELGAKFGRHWVGHTVKVSVGVA